MEHGSSFLQSGVVFLIAAVFMVPLAKRLQLGAVLGYLLAGVLIGPSVLGLVDNPESVAQISEMGVVLLLFIIGLELSPRRLWVMRKSVFGVGLLQVLLTGLVIGTVALVGFDQPVNSAVVLGLGLVIGLIFLLAWLVRRVQQAGPRGNRLIRTLASQPLGPRDRLVLVQVGEEQILLGLTPGRITPLHVLKEPVHLPDGEPATPEFAQRLLELLNKDPKGKP